MHAKRSHNPNRQHHEGARAKSRTASPPRSSTQHPGARVREPVRSRRVCRRGTPVARRSGRVSSWWRRAAAWFADPRRHFRPWPPSACPPGTPRGRPGPGATAPASRPGAQVGARAGWLRRLRHPRPPAAAGPSTLAHAWQVKCVVLDRWNLGGGLFLVLH